MQNRPPSTEFDQIISPDGALHVPERFRNVFGPGSRVHVRLTDVKESSVLVARDITEEEIKRIAVMQMETREQVVKCLLAEGSLAKGSFRRRSRSLRNLR